MKFFVALYRPTGCDASTEGPDMAKEIGDLNDEMTAAGARIMALGLTPPSQARCIHRSDSGELKEGEGLAADAGMHIGGFWILEADSMDAAMEWGRKAAQACRASVEVRRLH